MIQSPYDDSFVISVPCAGVEDVDNAVVSVEKAFYQVSVRGSTTITQREGKTFIITLTEHNFLHEVKPVESKIEKLLFRLTTDLQQASTSSIP